jgi:hypothetical protein
MHQLEMASVGTGALFCVYMSRETGSALSLRTWSVKRTGQRHRKPPYILTVAFEAGKWLPRLRVYRGISTPKWALPTVTSARHLGQYVIETAVKHVE